MPGFGAFCCGFYFFAVHCKFPVGRFAPKFCFGLFATTFLVGFLPHVLFCAVCGCVLGLHVVVSFLWLLAS